MTPWRDGFVGVAAFTLMAELARKAHLGGFLKPHAKAPVDIDRISLNSDCNTDKLGTEVLRCAA
jgi:hypothetical protein